MGSSQRCKAERQSCAQLVLTITGKAFSHNLGGMLTLGRAWGIAASREQKGLDVGNLDARKHIEDRYVIEVGVAQFLGLG